MNRFYSLFFSTPSRYFSVVLLFTFYLFTDSSFAQLPNNAGNALQFNGVDQYVAVADNNNLDITSNYTIEAWIKPHTFNFLGGIVSKYNTSGANGYTLRLSGDEPHTGINFNGVETYGGLLQADTWYHIAAVDKNGTLSVYINGVKQRLNGVPSDVYSNSDSLMIGVDYREDGRYFDGTIDEVRIWNVVRTPQEILQDMSSPVMSSETGLAAYWRFDEPSGETTIDLTLNGSLGNLVTGTTRVISDAPFPAPYFIASTSSINFGLIHSGTTKTDTLTITNLGGDTLTISDAEINNPKFTVTPSMASIPVSGSKNFLVTFMPDSDGAQEGILTFTHNAPDTPSVIQLSGVGGQSA